MLDADPGAGSAVDDLVVVYLRNWWGVNSDDTDEMLDAIYAAISA